VAFVFVSVSGNVKQFLKNAQVAQDLIRIALPLFESPPFWVVRYSLAVLRPADELIRTRLDPTGKSLVTCGAICSWRKCQRIDESASDRLNPILLAVQFSSENPSVRRNQIYVNNIFFARPQPPEFLLDPMLELRRLQVTLQSLIHFH
jgi:hypothetical protein